MGTLISVEVQRRLIPMHIAGIFDDLALCKLFLQEEKYNIVCLIAAECSFDLS